eukprot:Phypoly_transcript_14464.p1 GENE.Phypoly_transcript_14464~~Phypoly_transcript_14464.p1  ORF type:complete len:151 (+),score=22.21 Phypoly_transcript_14464:225-677(+)
MARAPGDRVIQNLPLQQTIKYTFANGGYSLSQHNKRGALLISPSNLLIFRSQKLLLDIKFEDPRWGTGGIRGEYDKESHTLIITVNTREYKSELERYLQNEPLSYSEGVMIVTIVVDLDQIFVDRIFKNQPPWSATSDDQITNDTDVTGD